MTGKEFFVPFELHSPVKLATERIEQFLRHSAALQLPGMEWRREAGSSSVGEYSDRVLRVQGAASRVVAHFFAPKTTHPFRRAAGFEVIKFILSTKKVDNKEIPFAVNKAALHIANIGRWIAIDAFRRKILFLATHQSQKCVDAKTLYYLLMR
jgi:hypothetical protein